MHHFIHTFVSSYAYSEFRSIERNTYLNNFIICIDQRNIYDKIIKLDFDKVHKLSLVEKFNIGILFYACLKAVGLEFENNQFTECMDSKINEVSNILIKDYKFSEDMIKFEGVNSLINIPEKFDIYKFIYLNIVKLSMY